MDCKACPNSRCFIQKHCQPEWLDFTQHYKTTKYLSSGKNILNEGELVTGIYIICSGSAKVLLKTSKGRDQIIRVAGKGQILGHRGFSQKMVYPITARTLAESEIAYIANEEFFKLIRSNKDLSFYLMMFFADELLSSEQKLRVSALQSSREKVATAILMLIKAFGYKKKKDNHVDLNMSLHELANFAAVAYPTLTRVIEALTVEGVLAQKKAEIIVLEDENLQKLASLETR